MPTFRIALEWNFHLTREDFRDNYDFFARSRLIAPNIASSTAFSTTNAVARLPRSATLITVTVIVLSHYFSMHV